MEMLGEYPALTVGCTINDSVTIATTLFKLPFVSKNRQSNWYQGHILSIGKVYRDTGGDMASFPSGIKSMYEQLYSQYFSYVLVTVDVRSDDLNAFDLAIEYGDGTTTESITDGIFVSDSLIELNNFGLTQEIIPEA